MQAKVKHYSNTWLFIIVRSGSIYVCVCAVFKTNALAPNALLFSYKLLLSPKTQLSNTVVNYIVTRY